MKNLQCLTFLSIMSVAAWIAIAGDGITPADFSPANGYIPATVADGGGLNTDPATKGCFVEAIWLETDDVLHSAGSGKNYFQNGIQDGTPIYGNAKYHDVLNGPFVANLSAEAAAPYLSFPGNKLVLGTGEANNSLNPMYFKLFNGTPSAGMLSDASAKPYYFGGDGLFMSGNCSLYPENRHGAISGRLTILSDDHDSYRQSKAAQNSGVVSCNVERWTQNQCSLVRLANHSNYYSMDIRADMFGGADAFLAILRNGTSVGPGDANHSTCRISGNNAGYYGTIAVESNCWLRLKTSLANATVKVGHRGWPELRSGTAGNAAYDKAVFDPFRNLSGHLETEANAGEISVGTLLNNCGDVMVKTGSSLIVGDLEYAGGDFTIELGATAAACGSLVVTSTFVANHTPVRIVLLGSSVPSSGITLFSVPATSGLTTSDFSVSGPEIATVVAEDGAIKVKIPENSMIYQVAEKTPGLGSNDDYVNTFFFASDCWSPAGAPVAGSRYYNKGGYQGGGPRFYDNAADIPVENRTFAGDAYVLGDSYTSGLDTSPVMSYFSFFNGWQFDGTGKNDVESRPYIFGGDGLYLKNYSNLSLGRFGALQGRLTVLGDDAMAYAIAGNEDRQYNAVATVQSTANTSNPWGLSHDGELVGARSAFLIFHKSASSTLCNKVSELRFNGNTDGYYGRLAVETNCLIRLKNGLPNGGVVIGWRGWPIKGLNWNLPYAADSDVSGKVLFPANRGTIGVGMISNNCGAVTVEAGTNVRVGDFYYNGGIIHIGSTATAIGSIEVTNAFSAIRKPVRVRFDSVSAPEGKMVVIKVPATSGVTADDFVFSGTGLKTVREVVDGMLTISMLGIKMIAAGEKITVGSFDFSTSGYAFGISPTVGGSGSLTVNGPITVGTLPIKIGLVGNGNSMPSGEMVKLISWCTADNPQLDICDFDFSLLGNHDNFGPGGTGRGYPVLKVEHGMSTLYLDCSEVLKTAADTGYNADDKTSFRNGNTWEDGQLPHQDANYYANGYVVYAPGNTLAAKEFPDGVLVPAREFHGNRLRVGNRTELHIEKMGTVTMAQDGLVLQQGGQLHFYDDGLTIAGKVHCASLYGDWNVTDEYNRTGCENASSVTNTGTRYTADFTSDRNADFTVFATSWFAQQAEKRNFIYCCTFDGSMDGFYGTLICENRCRIDLNRNLPNGTVKLGWTGLPFSKLGPLDDHTNGWLSASCENTRLSISNLVVNGARVSVKNGNTYMLKSLTLNGGMVEFAVQNPQATQIAVDGPVAVTHVTRIVLAKRPGNGVFFNLVSWPASEEAPDLSKFSFEKETGEPWSEEECTFATEMVDGTVFLRAISPIKGTMLLFR